MMVMKRVMLLVSCEVLLLAPSPLYAVYAPKSNVEQI